MKKANLPEPTPRRRSTDHVASNADQNASGPSGETINLGRGFDGEERSYGGETASGHTPGSKAGDGMGIDQFQDSDAEDWPEWRKRGFDEQVRRDALADDPKSDYGRGSEVPTDRRKHSRTG